jgi:inorganic pyrophosphatase
LSCKLASQNLPPFLEGATFVNCVVDTPRGAPFKLKLDEHAGIFRVHKAMPLGFEFPFNFGYIPSTRGEDGDALDVLLLAEFVFPVGCIAAAGLVAVLEAEQVEGRKRERNDRLIGVPVEMVSRKPMLQVPVFDKRLKKALADFFVKYNELQGRSFEPMRYAGAKEAIRLVRKAHATWLSKPAT